MCGFIGFINKSEKKNYSSEYNVIKMMNDTLSHRGPDSEGFWLDITCGIALAHRRLSIMDISQNGHQPMVSNNGQYVLVYNGEIYNHKNILKDLKNNFQNINLRGHSDTEILLIAFEKWGVEKTLKKIAGMFSIALWCRKNRKLFLARDRMGEKPLYYGWQGVGGSRIFFFGSELKAFTKHPNFQKKINKNAVKTFFKFSCVQAPETIYQNIYKLMPGTFMEYDYGKDKHSTKSYWSLIEKFFDVSKNFINKDLDSATEELNLILNKTIKEQMQSDVPYGSFLSGGIDSSTITAIMQSNSNKKINTFSVGFDKKNFDESKSSKSIAEYLGTNHDQIILKSSDVISTIPSISEIYDEPFADSSQIPTIFLSKLAKKKVTVALSGDGADEIFGGYNRYVFTEIIWKRMNILPHSIKKFVFYVIKNISFTRLKFLDNYFKDFSNKFKKTGQLILKRNIEELYYNFLSSSENVNIDNLDYGENLFKYQFKLIEKLKPTEQIMIMDLITYLSNDILTKVDRASMSVGLETRMPFLDHRIVEFSFKLPLNYKIQNSQTKIILKNVLKKYIPSNFFKRSKSGFAMPIGEWLRYELKEWGSTLLEDNKFSDHIYLDSTKIKSIWKEHLDGVNNHEKLLWNTLIFKSWLKQNYF